MKLYSVCNGFLGADMNTVLVIAEDAEQAKDQAVPQFERKRHPHPEFALKRVMYAHLLCDDTSKHWSSSVSDGSHFGEENL